MIIKAAILTRVSRKVDKSLTITFNTAIEQSNFELAELDSLYQFPCMLAIKEGETPFLDNELADLDNVDLDLEDTKKTPSKRLRSCLYRLWEKDKQGEFKDFYKTRMEQIISHIKNKLD